MDKRKVADDVIALIHDNITNGRLGYAICKKDGKEVAIIVLKDDDGAIQPLACIITEESDLKGLELPSEVFMMRHKSFGD